MNSQRVSNKNNIIGEGSTFEGTITLDGALRVDGTFLGKNLAMEHVEVGKTGKIKSKITAGSIVVEGIVLGDMESKIRTMLLPTAKILGNITTPELIIQNGVMWDGHCYIRANKNIDTAGEITKAFE